nr:uncharacterized protein LOC124811932 [Hydra vulgaris]
MTLKSNQSTVYPADFSFGNEGQIFTQNCDILLTSKLSAADLQDISANHMLSDNVIHTVQKMIRNVCGLQDPVLGQNYSFKVVNESFIQVLHDGAIHWVTISTFGCAKDEVCVLDSMFHGNIKKHVIRQICSIMNCSKDILTVRVLPVQQQTNGVDCGLFALAFAQHIAYTSSNPSFVAFDSHMMRKHLLQSITENNLNDFPKTKKSVKFCKEKVFSLHCTCRQLWMPLNKFEKNSFRDIVQCNNCEDWFHGICQGLLENVLKNENLEWSCQDCLVMYSL